MVQSPQQEKEKVQLVSAQSAQLIEKDGESFRKVVGPARFRHNNTDLLCDTALWNVNTNIIDAVGNVRIIQERTRLSSATLQYVVDENMARFRGDLVQLEDSDGSVLRTRYLDYNTKDSVAVFQNGAAMRDKDGQIIESTFGTYDAKAKLFVFNDKVNMYLDTTFVKTSRLEYRSDISTAFFGFGTDMWQGKDMLSANDGWYDRQSELFFFRRKVHLLTEDQESWSDSLWYHRNTGDVEMLGNVEIMDTTRNVFALAGRFEYTDSLSKIRMTRDPAVMSIDEDESGKRDTIYVGADILTSRGVRRCDVPDAEVNEAARRLNDIAGDPVMEYRRKAAEAAAKAAEAAAKDDPAKLAEEAARKLREQRSAEKNKGKGGSGTPAHAADSAASVQQSAPADTAASAPADTIATAPVDTLPPPPDTTKINFLWGSGNVRLFRRDMQMASDSITYTDLDSLARLYKDPIFYNNGNRQYVADSIYLEIKNKRMEKAHLLSNAFITIEEEPGAYDQVRGAEMTAYFDSTNALTRFDALGGASSLFYLEENGTLATVNKVDSKMIYATFKDNDIERLYYYDNPQNDGYPTVQMQEEDKSLKGFRWDPDKRPKSPQDVTALVPRKSERLSYLARPHASFVQTEIYFPGHIGKVYRSIEERDSIRVAREREDARRRELEESARADSLAAAALEPVSDTITVKPPADSAAVSASSDTTSVAPAVTTEEIKPQLSEKELKKQERERQKALKEAERNAKWDAKLRREEEKKAEKARKKLEKERAKKLKALQKMEKQARKDRARFEKYLQREREKAARRAEKEKNTQ